MSGIFGYWNLDERPVEHVVLQKMAHVLSHRGPDGHDIWRGGSIGLGHRMFRVTPQAVREVQPLAAPDQGVVLVADLRIDNRKDLQPEPRSGGVGGTPDPELVLAAFLRHGVRAAEQLLGAFAVAVWDGRCRRLHLIRDHFGVKPLYYVHLPGRLFAFASEIKALWCIEQIPDRLDRYEIARHLLVPLDDDPGSTYFEAVRRVLPGSTVTVSPENVQMRRYWELQAREPVPWSDDDCSQAVRETFTEAVRCRLCSSTPVASMLSGGLDSSSVTCVATRLSRDEGRSITTLSAVFPDVPESDESRYIEMVRSMYGLSGHAVATFDAGPLEAAREMDWFTDHPTAAGNQYLNWELYRRAGKAGGRVVLDGYDGDSTLSHGHGHLILLAQRWRWISLSLLLSELGRRQGWDWRIALKRWLYSYGYGPIRKQLIRILGAANGNAKPDWSRVLDPEYASQMKPLATDRRRRFSSEADHHVYLLGRSTLLHTLSTVEAMGAGRGVEVRFPFFDVRLAELCVSLPVDQKMRDGLTRFAMRSAMQGILPEGIRLRPTKGDLSPGFAAALRRYATAGEVALPDELLPFLDRDEVMALRRRVRENQASKMDVTRNWRILSLAGWLKRSRSPFTAEVGLGAVLGAGITPAATAT